MEEKGKGQERKILTKNMASLKLEKGLEKKNEENHFLGIELVSIKKLES